MDLLFFILTYVNIPKR